MKHQADGPVQLQFSGVSGLSYIVEASGDLQTWEIIGVATPLAGNIGQRFYRVVLP